MSASLLKFILRAAGAFFILTALISCGGNLSQVVLFEDNFENLPSGYISTESGPLLEFQYLSGVCQRGDWSIAAFGKQEAYHNAWELVQSKDGNFLHQNYSNITDKFEQQSRVVHPIIVAGDSIWHDYKLEFTFSPGRIFDKCGVVFKYQNSRCYYYYGKEGNSLVIKLIKHSTAPKRPFEKVLASRPFTWEEGERYKGEISIHENKVYTLLNDSLIMITEDNTYTRGKVGFLSDGPASFYSMKVTTLKRELRKINRYRAALANERTMKISENPKPVLWKKIPTPGYGTGRSIRFGDLNNDGEMDILIGQVVQHGHDSEYSELSCLTAINLEGKILWQTGKPAKENYKLSTDVAFQIHDMDGDGSKEVVYTMNYRLNIADGKTGRIKKSRMTPIAKPPADKYDRILGDCIYFCDLKGKGRDSDILIKDRFWNIWAFNERLQLLWTRSCKTGHYPFAYDIDKDGKDEIAVGYSMIDDDGSLLWNRDNEISGDANSVVIANLLHPDDSATKIIYGASEWGMMILDTDGIEEVHRTIGNVQHSTLANLSSEKPGLEIATINFWGSQGIVNFYNAKGNIYKSLDASPYGSMCLPVNWKGDGEEYILLNSSPGNGGLIDGTGEIAAVFPDDGHPVYSNAVVDLTGDLRDEIVTWDKNEIWIYTQNDSPRPGKMYSPVRNPLYNRSNFQFNYSFPFWDD